MTSPVVAPAAAEPAPASPLGQWSFASGKMRGGCMLAGHMDVKAGKNGALSCAFTARWTCQATPARSVDTVQSCSATQAGSDIAISSKIDKISRVEPSELMAYMQDAYAADHFKVRINTKGDEMRGLFHSYGQAEVIFRRRVSLVG